jgi:hypothetical protein
LNAEYFLLFFGFSFGTQFFKWKSSVLARGKETIGGIIDLKKLGT